MTSETTALDAIEISRVFAAPRARVFAAWSTDEAIKRWFSPEGCTTPAAEVDFRPGGVFTVCMGLPDGSESWARGRFEELEPLVRLALSFDVEMGGAVRFSASTIVTFADEGPGARMAVRQSYRLFDPAFAAAPKGAFEGWRTTLNKLAIELARRDEEFA